MFRSIFGRWSRLLLQDFTYANCSGRSAFLLKQSNLAEAVAALKEAVGLDPYSARYHLAFAVALERSGQHAEALEQYQAALRLSRPAGR